MLLIIQNSPHLHKHLLLETLYLCENQQILGLRIMFSLFPWKLMIQNMLRDWTPIELSLRKHKKNLRTFHQIEVIAPYKHRKYTASLASNSINSINKWRTVQDMYVL